MMWPNSGGPWKQKQAVKALLLNLFETIEILHEHYEKCAEFLQGSIADAFVQQAQNSRQLICGRCKAGEVVTHLQRNPTFWHRVDLDKYESCPASAIIESYGLEGPGQGPVGTGINKGAYPPPYPNPYRGVPLFREERISDEQITFRLKGIVTEFTLTSDPVLPPELSDAVKADRYRWSWIRRLILNITKLLKEGPQE